MNQALTIKNDEADKIERVLIGGDLAQLKPEERVSYYRMVCESVGLNPLTKPFEYITLNGKLTLYARKDCTDQLRSINNISVVIADRQVMDDCFVVTAQASTPQGRTDGSIGAVSIGNLKGEARCNAMMKAETKAKRRVTLSICGLGILDETEIESIPDRNKKEVEVTAQPTTFKSAASNQGKVTEDLSRGPSVVEAAVISTAGSGDAPKVNDGDAAQGEKLPTSVPAAAVDYITAGQAKNIHIEFRKEVKKYAPNESLKADDHFYQFLTDQGLLDGQGQPSAGAIPASKWFHVKQAALEYARNL